MPASTAPLQAVAPMLAVPGDPPSGDAWAAEVKYDGARACVVVDAGRVEVRARSGRDVTGSFPELVEPLAAATGTRAVLDGEVVVLGPAGVPDFGLLQHRLGRDGARARAARRSHPVRLVAFDCLHDGDRPLLDEPWSARRGRLEAVVPRLRGLGPSPVDVSPVFDDAADVLDAARRLGWEGVVVKRRDAPYRPGVRSPDWVKHRLLTTSSFLVGGWEVGEGRRSGRVGALLVGRRRPDGTLRYDGQVGSGLTEDDLDALAAVLPALAADGCPFDPAPPADVARAARWVDPLLVVDVHDRGRTATGLLRQASAHRLRPDLRPDDVPADAGPAHDAAAGTTTTGGSAGG